MQYRRVFVPGGTYFFTVVTNNRRPIFNSPEAINILRLAFLYAQKRFPFKINAIAILPDHLHTIWTLPSETSDYPTRWRLIKTFFSRNWRKTGLMEKNPPRNLKGEVDVWQRRFWEHLIRDEEDLHNHIDYIHFNPVKHGYVSSPSDWKHSSFMKFVDEGLYPLEWRGGNNGWEGDPRFE